MHTAFRTRLLTCFLSGLAITSLMLAQPAGVFATALDDYVAAPDPNYAFSLVHTLDGPGYTVHVLDMKSQQWRSPAEVLDGRHIWQHWLLIIIPDTVITNQGMLWIDGGSNGGSPPGSIDSFLGLLGEIARNTGSVVTQLKMVPNERLKFADETDPRYIDNGRTEDEIIAYTFDKFLTTGDPTWPLLGPMTKSAVRAMDTVQTYVSDITDETVFVNKFVVSGGSKRGWTTWLTAAVDDRVLAIVPAVIDVLNMDVQMEHHFSAYGFFSPAVQDYVDMNIFDRFDLPESQELLKIVDPYEYRDRLVDMPRYMINSTGDEFFLPDAAQFYIDDLEGERFLRYVPNTSHGLDNSDAPESLAVFYSALLSSAALPEFTWTVEANGAIRVETQTPPSQVNLWQATNPVDRIFMLAVIGPAWTSSPLSDQGGGVYVGQVSEPPSGWTAYMVELVYNTPFGIPFKFTTQVVVTPDELPFPQQPDCNENGFSDPLDMANGTDIDCDANGTPDSCDLADGLHDDCNENAVPDPCDLASGTSLDCDGNGQPDECQVDADDDGTIDACEQPEQPEQPSTFTLTVSIAGNGTVDISPNKDQYESGESVDLLASPAGGWQFAGWSGDRSSADPAMNVQIVADTFLQASFENPAPAAAPGGPYNGEVGQNIAFSGNQSADPLGESLTFQWDFGDGSSADTAAPGHAYAAAGTFTVALTVIDPAGNSATAGTTATITPAPSGPEPTPTPTEPTTTTDQPANPLANFLAAFCGGLQPLTLLMTFAGLGLMRTRRRGR